MFFKHKSLKIGSLCIGFPFLWWFLFYVLLDHLDPEGDAAQVLIPFVVVAQVRALYPALHRQLLVVVLLPQQQLHGHQGLQVIVLHRGRRRAFVNIASPRVAPADTRINTYMGFLAIVGEVHLIEVRLAGEILYLYGDISLSRRAAS